MINGGQVKYYDPTDVSNLGKTLGITDSGVTVGGSVNIITEGTIMNYGWGLTQDAVYYAGINGTITTIVPIPPFIQQRVGVAIDSNTL